MTDSVSFDNFHFEIGRRIDDDVYSRVVTLAQVLEQMIREVYRRELTTSNAVGALPGIKAEVERTLKQTQIILGVTKQAEHLLFLEFGERGTESAGKGFVDIGTNTRTKAPKVKTIRDWIRLASMPIFKSTIERAEANRERADRIASKKVKTDSDKKFDTSLPWYSDDPLTLAAFYIAQARKKHGRRAMRIFERVLTQQRDVIQRYLAGA